MFCFVENQTCAPDYCGRRVGLELLRDVCELRAESGHGDVHVESREERSAPRAKVRVRIHVAQSTRRERVCFTIIRDSSRKREQPLPLSLSLSLDESSS